MTQTASARLDALPSPVAMAIVAALLVCPAAAWLVTDQQAAPMSGMGDLAMPGAGLFLVTVFFLEKNWSQGVMLARVVGTACVLLGAAVLVRPDLLSLFSGPMA